VGAALDVIERQLFYHRTTGAFGKRKCYTSPQCCGSEISSGFKSSILIRTVIANPDPNRQIILDPTGSVSTTLLACFLLNLENLSLPSETGKIDVFCLLAVESRYTSQPWNFTWHISWACSTYHFMRLSFPGIKYIVLIL
jgi:hypothetical protein